MLVQFWNFVKFAHYLPVSNRAGKTICYDLVGALDSMLTSGGQHGWSYRVVVVLSL